MFDRITTRPDVLGGKPIVKGTRISVELILELVASGGSVADIVRSYPFLTEPLGGWGLVFGGWGRRPEHAEDYQDYQTTNTCAPDRV